PEQQVTKEQMIETGQSFLKHMKLDEHQVLFVAHNDTRHPHVHLIVNRVHPETGMTHDSNWYKTRSQKWALAYEREQGRIFCEAREVRYGQDKERDVAHVNHREWKAWQEIAKEKALDPEHAKVLKAGEWQALDEGQRRARVAYWD